MLHTHRRGWLQQLGTLVLCSWMSVASASEAARHYSPALTQQFPTRLLWGDTHLHTNLSVDAAAGGNRLFGPDEAYRLARGEAVRAHNGMLVQLNRPLDFLVAADHAETMGLFPGLAAADPLLLETQTGKRWYQMYQAGPTEAARILVEFGASLRDGKDLLGSAAFTRGVWQRVTANADNYNQPGKFSAFIGYEWSSGRGGGNMHRIVIFADDAERVNQVVPFSSYDDDRPRALWRYMANYEATTGGQVLAIPHNSNVSAGLMFALSDSDGNPISAAYARERSRWEPLTEVTQFKGDSETHPFVSPADAFADYESWDKYAGFSNSKPHEDAMFAGEYARPALRRGLALFSEVGVNPFKFGMIGSTDSHNASPGDVDEAHYDGCCAHTDVSPQQRLDPTPNFAGKSAALRNPGGLVGLWSEDNSREALFSAMQRREAFATSGPRITPRLFVGAELPENICKHNFAQAGYAAGVPMGGVIETPLETSPVFAAAVSADPRGGLLQRLQMVKVWHDDEGVFHQSVTDIAGNANNGASVDLNNCAVGGEGAGQFCVTWKDPSFDPQRAAAWYLRAVENPSCRWSWRQCLEIPETERPVTCDDPDVPRVIQERAWSSPVWYSPKT